MSVDLEKVLVINPYTSRFEQASMRRSQKSYWVLQPWRFKRQKAGGSGCCSELPPVAAQTSPDTCACISSTVLLQQILRMTLA